jgi:hypothetical protein
VSGSSQFRANYLAALALPGPDAAKSAAKAKASESNPKKDALARAHDLRKFEIENYWKRATYFWAFQVAAFALLGLIWKDVGDLDRLALLVPAGLGAISAQVAWITAKGSKFWQENWEAHVDLLEQDVEGRMTQVVLSKEGAQYSVSAVNQHFMFLLMLGWIGIFVVVVFEPIETWLRPHASVLALLALALAMIWLPAWSRSNLRGWLFKSSQTEWHPYDAPTAKKWFQKAIVDGYLRVSPVKPEIVLRDTLSGRLEKPEPKT